MKRAALLAFCAAIVVACSSANREELRKASDEARAKVNQYCDARQKTLDALGAAGAQP